MSILIKGMEMPKPELTDQATVYCAYILIRPNGHAVIVVDNEDGLDSTEYPLVPVPPHGRLIDADELYKEALERSETKDGYYNCLDHVISCYTIDNAPTIIPAEEEHEENA